MKDIKIAKALTFFLLLLFLMISGCLIAPEVDEYDWSKRDPSVLNGLSILDIMETPSGEVLKNPGSLNKILEFYNYPDSRAEINRKSRNSYIKDLQRETRPGSGINLGNALDAPSEGEWGVSLKEDYFTKIASAGFETIRLPVRFQSHVLLTDSIKIDPVFQKRVDWAIDNALKRNRKIILDFHHYLPNRLVDFRTEEEKEKTVKLFLEIWKIQAEHYRDYPEELSFELLNEPHLPFSREIWNEVIPQAISIIRDSGGNNSQRTIIVGAGTWSHAGALEYLKIPSYSEDPNIMVTFHYYEPFSFTHQGAEWSVPQPLANSWRGNTWTGTEVQKGIVQRDFKLIAEWAENHERKILLGEFGAIAFADVESRATYTSYIREQAEKNGFEWNYWLFTDQQNLFGVYDDEKKAWHEDLLNALLPLEE